MAAESLPFRGEGRPYDQDKQDQPSQAAKLSGAFCIHDFIFNGEIIARKSEGFGVRKIGFERFLALSAQQYPLLYGLACVALALFSGWFGGVTTNKNVTDGFDPTTGELVPGQKSVVTSNASSK